MTYVSPDYHYFASRTTTPQRILEKNLERGFGVPLNKFEITNMIDYYKNFSDHKSLYGIDLNNVNSITKLLGFIPVDSTMIKLARYNPIKLSNCTNVRYVVTEKDLVDEYNERFKIDTGIESLQKCCAFNTRGYMKPLSIGLIKEIYDTVSFKYFNKPIFPVTNLNQDDKNKYVPNLFGKSELISSFTQDK
jgi:hypothetical protein